MSSPSAQALLRAAKREKRRWAHRANAIRVLKNGQTVAIQPNSALPRRAPRAQSTYTETRHIVMKVLEENVKKVLPGRGGKLTRLISTLEISRLTQQYTGANDRISVRAVAEALMVLRRQHNIVWWDAGEGVERSRAKGDGYGKGCYRLLIGVETLERRQSDPRVGKTASGEMYVLGKERRLLNQAELDSWGIDEPMVMTLGAAAEPARVRPDEPDEAPETRAEPPHATGPPGEAPHPLPGNVWRAFRSCVKDTGFSKATARDLVKKVRAQASGRGETVSDAEIEKLIVAGRKAVGSRESALSGFT